ncbi:hypothetical protein [Planomicrobium sp. YIM 101495]|uniref:hypothetical protein n=1 Tax=Planomicrobium sp. YIM 101495 TaxID=2665160 RepID=UPI0018ABEC0D|nr:hypothetical protein [Planomicrobium sp. YIM 101495]
MKYFIDHLEKRIHLRQFAGDACGFIDTPIEKREFSDEEDYFTQLVVEESYTICAHCRS